jgi:hypothetical protein
MKSIVVVMSGAVAACASAGPIWSPSAVVRNDYGELGPNYAITHVFSQAGLYSGFISGVTDFDAYAPSGQLHKDDSQGNDWYGPGQGYEPGGFVDFDLGQAMQIARAAVWNEDAGGIGTIKVYTSIDEAFTSPTLVGEFTLSDNAFGVDYAADVLDLIDTFGRYVRFEILSLGAGSQWTGVSLGEVAFEERSVQIVPLPSGAGLAGVGLLALASRRRQPTL